jgi:hypothetical protein
LEHFRFGLKHSLLIVFALYSRLLTVSTGAITLHYKHIHALNVELVTLHDRLIGNALKYALRLASLTQ